MSPVNVDWVSHFTCQVHLYHPQRKLESGNGHEDNKLADTERDATRSYRPEEPDSNTAYPLKGATRVEVTAPDGTITLQATTHRTGSEGNTEEAKALGANAISLYSFV